MSLRTITPEELKDTLVKHLAWRRGEAEGARAYLARADLTGANLARADLTGADLAGAYLTGADLTGADLARADLAGADLARADLARADLTGAYLAGANLTDADLTDADLADADLTDADLTDADLTDADLTGADLADAKNVPVGIDTTPREPTQAMLDARAVHAERYRQRHPEVPVVADLDRKILEAVTTGGGHLDMSTWHICATTHCRAGWAITLAGKAGSELEEKHGPERAGAMIYRASTGRVPYFYGANKAAMADILRHLPAR